MFFGLHTCLPDNRETQVFSTRQEASLMYSRAMERADFQIGFLHVRVNANAEIKHPPLRSGTFIAALKLAISGWLFCALPNTAVIVSTQSDEYGQKIVLVGSGTKQRIKTPRPDIFISILRKFN